MAEGNKGYLKTTIFVAISIVLIFLAFRNTDFYQIKEGLANANLIWLFVSICIAVVSHLFRALRWNLALEPLGYKINDRRSFYSVMIGYIVNLATARGGEIARCAVINQTDKVPINILIGTVITERIIDLVCLMLAILGAFIFQSELLGGFLVDHLINPILSKGIFGIIIIAILIFGMLGTIWLVSTDKGRNLLSKLPFGQKIIAMLNGFIEGLLSIRKIKRPFLFIAYSLGIWFCYWMMTYAVFFCFDFTAHFSIIVGLTALVFASIGMIVPAPGGAGALAVVILGMESIYGLSNADATLISTASLSANIILVVLLGSASLILIAFERKKLSK